MRMSIDRLPNEILSMIFRFIDGHRERTRLERVCRKWRQVLMNHGWKHVRRIALLNNAQCIEPIGVRCGRHLVECSFCSVTIDPTLIRLIANNFPALKNLTFFISELKEFNDENALESVRELGARLHSLTFYSPEYQNSSDHQPNHQRFWLQFPHLRHLGLHRPYQYNIESLPGPFFAELRSLYLSYFFGFRPDLVPLLMRVQSGSPRLAALCLDTTIGSDSLETRPLLDTISNLKNLRLLRIAFRYDFMGSEMLCSCLNNLPHLITLQMKLPIKQLSAVSPCFRGLVHLSLSLTLPFTGSDNFESIGHLSIVAPQLRSLTLYINTGRTYDIGCHLLKIAQNGILEQLNVPNTSFTVEMLIQLVRLCPNLHSLGAQLRQNEPLPQDSDLSRVVANQWDAGTRKQLPLRIWLYGDKRSDISWRDSFLTIHSAHSLFTPPDPLLDALLKAEVFNDGEGIPSFVKNHYSSIVG